MDASLNMRKAAARQKRLRLLPNVLVTLVLVVLCFYFMAPVAWVVIASTKSLGGLYTSPPLWFGGDLQLWKNVNMR